MIAFRCVLRPYFQQTCLYDCVSVDTMTQMKCQGHRGEKVCQEPRANWSVCSF